MYGTGSVDGGRGERRGGFGANDDVVESVQDREREGEKGPGEVFVEADYCCWSFGVVQY